MLDRLDLGPGFLKGVCFSNEWYVLRLRNATQTQFENMGLGESSQNPTTRAGQP